MRVGSTNLTTVKTSELNDTSNMVVSTAQCIRVAFMPLTDNGADADHLKRRIDFHGLLLPTLVLCREFCDLSSR